MPSLSPRKGRPASLAGNASKGIDIAPCNTPTNEGWASCNGTQDNDLRQLSTLIRPPFLEYTANRTTRYRIITYENYCMTTVSGANQQKVVTQ